MEDLSDRTYDKLREFLYEKTGIMLKEYKKYLVVNRLYKYLGKHREFTSYEDLYEKLITAKDNRLLTLFINALTTNFSFFFRENEHFEKLAAYLRDISEKEEVVRLWSAAGSTGEEAYSMAITAMKAMPFLEGSDFKILSTDISTRVLEKATRGCYEREKLVKNMSERDIKKFFVPAGGNIYQVKDAVKKWIAFRYLNLLDPYPFRKKFDVIFLRNVMIYFDLIQKQNVINKIGEYLKPGGLLFLSHSETLVGVSHSFKMLKNSVYRKEG